MLSKEQEGIFQVTAIIKPEGEKALLPLMGIIQIIMSTLRKKERQKDANHRDEWKELDKRSMSNSQA